MKNIRIFLSENFPFLIVKFLIHLNRRVFVMGCLGGRCEKNVSKDTQEMLWAGSKAFSQRFFNSVAIIAVSSVYIRHLSYCFCIAVNCSNIQGRLSPQALVGNPSRRRQLQTNTYISGFAGSSYVKSASVAGAEEIMSPIQWPKWQCSSMLWGMQSMTKH